MVESIRKAMREIALFISKASDLVNYDSVNEMVKLLVDAYHQRRRVLIIGAGRSGLVGRAFAMRLMHLGFNVYVLGETITPRIGKDDLVVAISGSGRTRLIVVAASTAKDVGAKVIALTSHPKSPLGSIADLVIEIPGRTKLAKEDDYIIRQILGVHEPLTPLGTLFENTCMAFLDGVIVELMSRLGLTEEELKERHANIE